MQNSQLTDILTWMRRAQTHAQAFGALYDGYVQRVYRCCLYRTSNAHEAEDSPHRSFSRRGKTCRATGRMVTLRRVCFPSLATRGRNITASPRTNRSMSPCSRRFTLTGIDRGKPPSAGRGGSQCAVDGDTLPVAQVRRYIGIMYSFPNLVALNKRAIECFVNAVEPFDFELIYGGGWDYPVLDANSAGKHSAERIIRAIS